MVARFPIRWPFATEDVVLDVEQGVRLLLRASWQTDPDRPALLLVHGLEGSDGAPYVLSTGILAYRAGWHVVRMNMRGCGDSLSICPRLYNAGLTRDLLTCVTWLAGRSPRLSIAAFSLGANLSLLTAAREAERLSRRLSSLVAVCPPLDMSRCADALEERGNWIYQRRFLRSLCRSYEKVQRLAPHLYAPGRARGLSTLRQFDDAVTAAYGGYEDAEHYYQSVSAGPHLREIHTPTLVLASRDDPFIPIESVERWTTSASVTMAITKSGGHVGFVGPSEAPGFFWAAQRTISWLVERS